MLAIYKFVISLLAAGILYYYGIALYGVRHDKNNLIKFVLIVGSTVGTLMLVENYIGVGVRAACVYIALLLGLFFILKLNVMQTLISFAVYTMSLFVGDSFIVYLLLKYYNYSTQQVKSSLLLSFTTDVLIYGTSIVILLIIIMLLQPKEIVDKLNKKAQLKTSIYMLFTVIVIIVNYSLQMQFINLINYKLVLTNLVITWLYLILSLYINFTARDLAIKEQQYNQQQDYIRTIDNLINDYRRLKHNHANTIYSIYGYIQESDWDGLKSYFDEIMEETKRISSNTLLALQKIKIYSVFGLLWAKVNKAEEGGLHFDVEVSNEISKINMRLSDFCEVLGNYLDNAIDGAKLSEAREINVSIIESDDYITFSIVNSCVEDIDIKRVYEKGFSTKGDNRGYGLYITEEILSKYDNILHNTNCENKNFKQELSIKK